MLDARLIRNEPEAVREALERRGEGRRVDEFLALDERRRALLASVEAGRADRNAAARAIAEARRRGEDAGAEIARQGKLKRRQADDEAALAAADEELRRLLAV